MTFPVPTLPVPPVSVLGLGQLGGSLAAALVEAGRPVSGWDVDRAARDAAAARGVTISPEFAGVVVLAVPMPLLARALDGLALDPDATITDIGSVKAPVLAELNLPGSLLDALDEESLDEEIGAETERALELAGRDVGTPIIHFRPPEGVAFFGPVISRLPTEDQAVELWDHIVGLARFPGFAELKRSLRERPQLRGLGVAEAETGVVEDWHGGSRRTTT